MCKGDSPPYADTESKSKQILCLPEIVPGVENQPEPNGPYTDYGPRDDEQPSGRSPSNLV